MQWIRISFKWCWGRGGSRDSSKFVLGLQARDCSGFEFRSGGAGEGAVVGIAVDSFLGSGSGTAVDSNFVKVVLGKGR